MYKFRILFALSYFVKYPAISLSISVHSGKQQHIESVLNQIEKDHKVKIKSKEVILLDDDETNISVARSCKMRALLIKGDDSLDELLEQR